MLTAENYEWCTLRNFYVRLGTCKEANWDGGNYGGKLGDASLRGRGTWCGRSPVCYGILFERVAFLKRRRNHFHLCGTGKGRCCLL